jgi:type I restriction enzyme R subunit
VIVSTIQKLGLALDENSKKARHHKETGRQTYKERLKPLRDKRIVIIFDECHRSQFGDNHQAIKAFFPRAQLFGFTGTPIFEDNASYKQIDGTLGSYRTTRDIFEKELHAYTITHAIDDRNVLRFHIDYYKHESKGKKPGKPDEGVSRQAVVESILEKHDAATRQRRFNAILATASINHAIAYYELFKEVQAERRSQEPTFEPLNIACVFSPPAEGNKDVRQLQEDLPQEKADNQQDPEKKKAALKTIIADYNGQYGTNHSINEFDLYYQDVQQRIKDQQYPNSDYPRRNKIDIIIVVDMLLTGFDSKYLNTLYVDKNLKHHGLIQAFSRTNRVLNDTKPYGNILDFRGQQQAVDDAIALFSGEDINRSREIWLVDPAPKVIERYAQAVEAIGQFMVQQGVSRQTGSGDGAILVMEPEDVYNLKGDAARAEFVNRFKEVQRLKTQLDQYTDLDEAQVMEIDALLPEEHLKALKGSYLETSQRLKAQQGKSGKEASNAQDAIDQLDFEFVLFSSALIDYDYIMGLAARFSQEKPGKQTMSREQLVNMLASSSNLMEERDDIIAYINSLQAGEGLSEQAIRDGYQNFKAQKAESELDALAARHRLQASTLKDFVEAILDRMIFDGEQLSDLFEPLELGWKARSRAEMSLMEELVPFLKRQAQGREISGLAAYE